MHIINLSEFLHCGAVGQHQVVVVEERVPHVRHVELSVDPMTQAAGGHIDQEQLGGRIVHVSQVCGECDGGLSIGAELENAPATSCGKDNAGRDGKPLRQPQQFR